jgi:hypothetical protein
MKNFMCLCREVYVSVNLFSLGAPFRLRTVLPRTYLFIHHFNMNCFSYSIYLSSVVLDIPLPQLRIAIFLFILNRRKSSRKTASAGILTRFCKTFSLLAIDFFPNIVLRCLHQTHFVSVYFVYWEALHSVFTSSHTLKFIIPPTRENMLNFSYFFGKIYLFYFFVWKNQLQRQWTMKSGFV